jgi:hypothetical protein
MPSPNLNPQTNKENDMNNTTEVTQDEVIDDRYIAPLGCCPICGFSGLYCNVSRTHWFYCPEHKLSWCAGSNLFSGWRYETEELWRKNAEYLDHFHWVEGVCDVRETEDWIAGKRAAILGRIEAQKREALEAKKAVEDRSKDFSMGIDIEAEEREALDRIKDFSMDIDDADDVPF